MTMTMNRLAVEALAELEQETAERQERQRQAPHAPIENASRYVQAAIQAECEAVAGCTEGRNNRLNQAAHAGGQFVGAGLIDRAELEDALYAAACQCGLDQDPGCGPDGIRRTLKSGIEKGMLQPRQIPEDRMDQRDKRDKRDKNGTEGTAGISEGSKRDNLGITWGSNGHPGGSRFEGNLTAEIREWIKNSVGSFTVQDIDREFGLTTKADKQLRSRILYKIRREESSFLKRDDRRNGVFHITKRDIQFFSISDVEDKSFPLHLPFGLHEMVRIPEKGLVIVAGQTNAGKSCFVVNALRANLGRGFGLCHLINEGRSEFRRRVERLGDDLARWEAVRIAECSAGFAPIIHGHNPDGLSCVDYLRETDGEYYRISSDIQAIADALTTGCSLVCIQKAAGSPYGRGGESTMEAARLYLSLDLLADTRGGSINALKIRKAKDFENVNPNGLEIHFKISKGVHMEPLSNWARIDDKQRAEMVKGYTLHHG